MPIPIQLGERDSVRHLLGEWAGFLERGLREHFGPDMHVARSEAEQELVIFLRQGTEQRGEILLLWDAAAPGELSIRPQAPRPPALSDAGADAVGFRTGVALALIATALWIGLAVWLWNDFWAIRGLRGKVFWLLVAAMGWLASAFGLGVLGYRIAARLWRSLQKPPAPAPGEEWVQAQLWPWLRRYLDELWQRARGDEILARRLAIRFQL